VIAAYDPRWPRRFAAERARLLALLGGDVVALEHFGSTAVPGLGAKPLLDLLAGVRSLAVVARLDGPLRGAGYEDTGVRLRDRRLYSRGGPYNEGTHHLHLVEHGSPAAGLPGPPPAPPGGRPPLRGPQAGRGGRPRGRPEQLHGRQGRLRTRDPGARRRRAAAHHMTAGPGARPAAARRHHGAQAPTRGAGARPRRRPLRSTAPPTAPDASRRRHGARGGPVGPPVGPR
jgi:hypothetical protein